MLCMPRQLCVLSGAEVKGKGGGGGEVHGRGGVVERHCFLNTHGFCVAVCEDSWTPRQGMVYPDEGVYYQK